MKDLETEESYDDNGSDTLAKKVVILKKNHEYYIYLKNMDLMELIIQKNYL